MPNKAEITSTINVDNLLVMEDQLFNQAQKIAKQIEITKKITAAALEIEAVNNADYIPSDEYKLRKFEIKQKRIEIEKNRQDKNNQFEIEKLKLEEKAIEENKLKQEKVNQEKLQEIKEEKIKIEEEKAKQDKINQEKIAEIKKQQEENIKLQKKNNKESSIRFQKIREEEKRLEELKENEYLIEEKRKKVEDEENIRLKTLKEKEAEIQESIAKKNKETNELLTSFQEKENEIEQSISLKSEENIAKAQELKDNKEMISQFEEENIKEVKVTDEVKKPEIQLKTKEEIEAEKLLNLVEVEEVKVEEVKVEEAPKTNSPIKINLNNISTSKATEEVKEDKEMTIQEIQAKKLLEMAENNKESVNNENYKKDDENKINDVKNILSSTNTNKPAINLGNLMGGKTTTPSPIENINETKNEETKNPTEVNNTNFNGNSLQDLINMNKDSSGEVEIQIDRKEEAKAANNVDPNKPTKVDLKQMIGKFYDKAS